MSYLIDTNVLSELRKGDRCNPGVRAWAGSQPGDGYLSVLTIGEIRRGIESKRRKDSDSAEHLEQWLRGLESSFGGRLLPVDQRVADVWGRLNVPNLVPTVDGLIAATALVHQLTLVTRDYKDMARTGVKLLNPFTP